MLGLWDVGEVGCSGGGMFGRWDVREVGCSGCGMFGRWDVRDLGCSECGTFAGMWDIDLQNAGFFHTNRYLNILCFNWWILSH